MSGRRSTLKAAALAAGALLLAAGLGAGWHLLRTSTAPRAADHVQAKGGERLFTCSMHPNVAQEGAGTCPICGMDLTPMKADKPGGGASDDAEGAVSVDPVMVQNMGLRVARAEAGALSHAVRAIGEVVVAEDLVSVVNLKFSGWIEKLYVDQTGMKVRRGQPLFSIYSPELVAAQEEYLLAVKAAGGGSPLARAARTKLALWDLSDKALRRIEQRGKARRTLTITAPRAGYVLHKSVVRGTKANAGQDLLRIGKLDAIWVHARIYEFDAPWIRVGQPATMELPFEQGKQYRGKVRYIYPTLDRKTRTLTVRLEFVNPSLRLKPGMFTTVRIKTRQRTNVLAVPTEAILRSGERNLVFVSRGGGKFEPRQVVTGLSGDGHRTEVLSGLTAGEVVVVSGQFLLDSESQLQEALQKLLAARLVAKQGGAAESAAGHKHDQQQDKKVIWTCPMHPTIAEDRAGACPICGMDLVEKRIK